MKITIDNLTKKFGNTVAVDNLSITMESGKMIALLGPSGCGKSTILNMLSGILPATSGKILFDDQDVTKLPPEKALHPAVAPKLPRRGIYADTGCPKPAER